MAQMSNRLDELKETHYRVTTGLLQGSTGFAL